MLASTWPHWTYSISWLWTNPASYNLWSSEWGGVLFKLWIAVLVLKHLNCHEHHCLRLSWRKDQDGHPICKRHHPDHPSRGWLRTDRRHPRHAANNTKEDA